MSESETLRLMQHPIVAACPNDDGEGRRMKRLCLTMADAPKGQTHRRPHPQPMSGPYLEFDLVAELEQLHREAEWETGQTGKTLVKYDDLRIVLTALKAHRRIAGHQTEARISIQTVAGHVLVRAQGRTFNLPSGSMLALDQGIAHAVEAFEDSAFLLTIAWPVGTGKRK